MKKSERVKKKSKMRHRGSFIFYRLDICSQTRNSRELHNPLIMRTFRFLDIILRAKKPYLMEMNAASITDKCRIRDRRMPPK